MTTENKKKYNVMEPVLNSINRSYVSLSETEKKRNNEILQSLLELLTNKMKEKDNLFKEMFSRVFYGGSFYDGLRVGKPDEYDLDLLLSLPKIVEPTLTVSNMPGYVNVQFKELTTFLKQVDLAARYKGLDKLIDEKNYLDTSKVLRWMERVVNLALNDFEKIGNDNRILKTKHGVFYAKVCKGGPAFTLKASGNVGGKTIVLDIDLVPCFIFGKDHWPEGGFRSNPVSKKPDFFIVPKPLKKVPNSNRCWRLSFQEQERELIDSKKTLKPTIKLLKKMRDQLNHKCIASYYIKTLLLWEVSEKRDPDFWNNSLSYVFMNVLKEYQNCLSRKKIPYFWNKKNNLIGSIIDDTMTNLNNKIKLIIEDVEKHIDDPFVIAKYLLNSAEMVEFRTEMNSNSELKTALAKLKV